MAVQVSNITNVAARYPVLSCGLLLLLAFPVFQLIVYFFPLFISTALCAALVTAGAPALSEPPVVTRKEDGYDESWLGRMRCLRECARLWWIECKLRIRGGRAGSSQPEAGDTCQDENVSLETEHEKRVHQLERTLRTLSFVSYEGIFSTDDTLVDLDEVSHNDDDEEPKPSEDGTTPATDHRLENGPASEEGEEEEAPRAPADDEESSAEQVESMSDDGSQESSSSWQEVESDTAQQSPA